MTGYPASMTYAALVAALDRAGFRPARVRPVSGFPAWGAPERHTAACPACRTEAALVVEPWGREDSRAVLYCTNADRCPSHDGARTERDVHLALLPAVRRAIEVSA